MNFSKRAWQSLWAKKGRTLLLIAVFSAILTFVLAGITIQSAADVATETAQESVGATVTLTTNREAMFNQASGDSDSESERPDPGSFTSTPVKIEDAEKIAALDGVASYSFEVSTSADQSSGVEPISSEATSSEASDSEDAGQMDRPGGAQMTSQGDFQIVGVSTSDDYSDFSDGTATLTEGEAITADDEGSNNVLIESALAQANEVSVGDTFTIKDAEENDVEVTIKGIYETSDTGDRMSQQFNFLNPANQIIASYTLANSLQGEASETIDSAVYQLADPKEMEIFVSEAESLIDTETFSLQTNDQMYQQMLEPLENVSSFAKNIIILVAVAGVVILTLIIMMTIRERRYEIGVLLSLGEARTKVIAQFFIEIFVCMVLALGIAGLSGNLVGNALGTQLLNQQTETISENSPQGMTERGGGPGGQMPGGDASGGFGNTFTQTEAVKELDITVKPVEILSLAGIGLGISMFSILIASVGIMRLNPKKILIS
ncbi:MAG: ABC transporter permease [Enterococcus sp.]